MEPKVTGVLPVIDTSLIPDHVRSDIGAVLLKPFLESIRDPEKRQRYNELGRAFLERQAEKIQAQKGGS